MTRVFRKSDGSQIVIGASKSASRFRVATSVGLDQTATFGNATPAGSGGFKPISNGAEFDLTSYDSLVSGSLGAYTPSISGGALIFDATGAPDGAVLRCSHAGGTVDIAISQVTGYTVRGDTQLRAGISAANAKVMLRPGDYDLDSAATGNGIFNQLNRSSNPTTFESTSTTARARFVDSYTKGLNSSFLTFRYLDFHMSAAHIASGPVRDTWFDNAMPDCTWQHCRFSGEAISDAALIAQTTYPTGGFDIPGNMKAGPRYTIEDCEFTYMSRAVSLETIGTCVFRRNTVLYCYDDFMGISVPVSTGPDDPASTKTIEDNTFGIIFGIYNEATASSPHMDGLQLSQGTCYNLTFRRNVVFTGNVRGDALTGLQNNGILIDALFEENIWFTKGGIEFYADASSSSNSSVTFRNCTCLDQDFAGGVSIRYASTGSTGTIENCVVNGTFSIAGTVTQTNNTTGFTDPLPYVTGPASPSTRAEAIAAATPVASSTVDTNNQGALTTSGVFRSLA